MFQTSRNSAMSDPTATDVDSEGMSIKRVEPLLVDRGSKVSMRLRILISEANSLVTYNNTHNIYDLTAEILGPLGIGYTSAFYARVSIFVSFKALYSIPLNKNSA